MSAQATLELYRQRFEQRLSASLPSEPADLRLLQAARYSCCEHGGKRLRPLLALACCADLSGSEQAAYPAAVALELLHCYSLIHDDLPDLDDDDYRRGAPSCHQRFDAASAILAGDYLQALAIRSLCSAPQALALIDELTAAAEAMVIGQGLDLQLQPGAASLEAVESMHRQKSAALIACSLKMGAICAHADSERQGRIYALGMELGLAFQIQDDVQDYASEPDKCTWPAVGGEAEARAEYRRLYRSCAQKLPGLGFAPQSLLAALLERMAQR